MQSHYKETQNDDKKIQNSCKKTQNHYKETQNYHKEMLKNNKEMQSYYKETQNYHKEIQRCKKTTKLTTNIKSTIKLYKTTMLSPLWNINTTFICWVFIKPFL